LKFPVTDLCLKVVVTDDNEVSVVLIFRQVPAFYSLKIDPLLLLVIINKKPVNGFTNLEHGAPSTYRRIIDTCVV